MTEIFIALIAPLGIDIEKQILLELSNQIKIKEPNAEIKHIRVSKLFEKTYNQSIFTPTTKTDEYKKRKAKIAIGNYLCESVFLNLNKNHPDRYIEKASLAYLAISEIASIRKKIKSRNRKTIIWLINQAKRPEEIYALRRIFRNSFFTLSFHTSKENRVDRLKEEFISTHKESLAIDLINQDEKEDHPFGQNLSDAFQMADFFIDCSNHTSLTEGISRFTQALYGDVFLSPTLDEFGMYLAEAESYRSLDLSRQVGASIINKHGSVIALGCNEVPKAHGGHYSESDSDAQRDRERGYDSNQFYKKLIMKELKITLNKMVDESSDIKENEKSKVKNVFQMIETKIEDDSMKHLIKRTRFHNLIEFGRSMHAELCAICDAARNHRKYSKLQIVLYTLSMSSLLKIYGQRRN